MPPLDNLTGALEDLFDLGENKNQSLDIAENGQVKKYGKLGDFANKFDQSSERNYLEEGYLRKDLFNVDPKQREILMQEPNITVLVKKRMFSTVAENFNPKFMDQDEKIFYKATKILFENKCKQLAAYEKLCKIDRAIAENGEFDTALIPLIIGLTDELLNTEFTGGIFPSVNTAGKENLGQTAKVIDQIKKVYTFSPNRQYTSWIKDNNKLFATQLGEGTGVIELTNVTQLNTTTTVHGESGGSCSLTLSDPYELMVITDSDIEKALSDATNVANNHLIFRMGQESADNIIARNTKALNDKRRRRGACDITFKINPETLLGRRVVAIADALGEEVNFTYESTLGLGDIGNGKSVVITEECLRGGALLGEHGLATKVNQRTTVEFAEVESKSTLNTEENLFKDIIINLFNKIQLDGSSRSINRELAKKNNYARRKIRFHFLGKLILQPMDQIHIYIGSKTVTDNKVLSGLQNSFTGLGVLQNANIMINDIKNTAYSAFKPSGNIDFEMEKSVMLGKDFPSYWWGVLRNQFVNDRGGTHVFGGLISKSSSTASNDSFSVSISGRDNLDYLTQGYVNFKPGAEVWNGALYDPLTPFQTKFDAVSSNFKGNTPVLLEENQKMLSSKKRHILKFKDGPLAGQNATGENLIHDAIIDNQNVKRRVFYAPDGLVYKWKEGIGTFVVYGDAFQANDPNKVLSSPTIAPPLAGQDIMNSISLLITGQPYNYATYYKAIREFGGNSLPDDKQSGSSGANSFYDSFRSDLKKRSLMWGNFIPFKNLVIGESQYSATLQGQTTIDNINTNINKDLIELQNLFDSVVMLETSYNENPTEGIFQSIEGIRNKIINIKLRINDANDAINKTLTSDAKSLSVVGSDVSFDYDNFINTSTSKDVNKNLFTPSLRKQIRKKINFLTRRFSWKVRANEDQNLMIVDDSYDKDYDIIAFEKELKNIELLNSEFTSVKDKVIAAAQVLNIEVFCDSQGHIRARPPQWNKIPSSIFYRMLQLKDDSGIQLFPEFLSDLFVNQLKGILQRIESLEDLIRLDVIILGSNKTNIDIENYINSKLKGAANAEGSFKFFSIEDGTIDSVEKIIEKKDFSKFENASKTTRFFTTQSRSDATLEMIEKADSNKQTDIKNKDLINSIISRIEKKTGQQVNLQDFLFKTEFGTADSVLKKTSRPNIVKLTIDLSNKIGERQKLVKIANSLLSNFKELKSIDNDKSIGNKILIPGTFNNSQIPEFFENLIEDESYDDFGPGSGSRYVVKNNRILGYTIEEDRPEYTHVSVSGQIDPNAIQVPLPSELGINNGGNALVTAEAVDYDMWRMYGMTQCTPVKVPFLSNPQSQCAPYASTLLSKARKNILKGTVNLVGNEYMQPGEIIYLEPRGLLFYVESVSHNFSYDNNFQTTLTLTYGHTPGDYIATPFDIIGKMIYINRDNTELINFQHSNVFNELNLGSVLLDTKYEIKDNNYADALFAGTYGTRNDTIIKNMIYYAASKINAHATKGSNINVKVELRIYSDTGVANDKLSKAASALKNILIYPDSAPNAAKNIKSANLSFDAEDNKGNSIIEIKTINMSDTKGERRRPSDAAYDHARNILESSHSATSQSKDSDKYIDNKMEIIYSSIIDCYITFEDAKPAIEGIESPKLGSSI